MEPQYIVVGQRVSEAKTIRARQFRREMTPAERRLWGALRNNQVSGLHFRRQQIIDGFIVDFYCHAAGLIVEVDGAVHDEQAGQDAERDQILAARNLLILRVTNEDVFRSLPNVLRRIEDVIRRPLPRPLPDAGRGAYTDRRG